MTTKLKSMEITTDSNFCGLITFCHSSEGENFKCSLLKKQEFHNLLHDSGFAQNSLVITHLLLFIVHYFEYPFGLVLCTAFFRNSVLLN